jgi:hypothetical protein
MALYWALAGFKRGASSRGTNDRVRLHQHSEGCRRHRLPQGVRQSGSRRKVVSLGEIHIKAKQEAEDALKAQVTQKDTQIAAMNRTIEEPNKARSRSKVKRWS